jgi:folate-dependent phosphoribosylglycinamide formyltransferase PurN
MKKKFLIFSGTHPRHIYVNSLFKNFNNIKCCYIFMKRENMVPKFQKTLPYRDLVNMRKHFNSRKEKEILNFGNLDYKKIFKKNNYIEVESGDLNSDKVYNYIKKFKPNFTFIFGVDLLKKKIINLIDKKNINLHLGLSPWYKGSATLFWPFYFLQPHFCGATFHQITEGIDDGPILHHSVPKLLKGQSIHDVSINVVKKAKADLKKIIIRIIRGKKLVFKNQLKNGKTFFSNSFKYYHLRLIYNLFKDKIIDFYLKNKTSKKINLVKYV